MAPQPPSRRPTYPLAHAFRKKPRRLPLVLRFAKGAVHDIIAVPVILHSLFTVLIVYLDTHVWRSINIPSTIIPSLSIVVGLMLVFRNSTSYDRFWTGRNCLTTIGTSVRNLARIILVNSHDKDGRASESEKRDTERVVRCLVAILYAIKHNLRAEFNIPPASLASLPPQHNAFSRSQPASRRPSYVDRTASTPITPSASTPLLSDSAATLQNGDGTPPTQKDEYISLLPEGLMGYEDQGLGLPLQLTVLLESYIRRGVDRSWFHAPLASQMSVQINSLVDSYGKMETIRSTPIPVAHLIHQKQVLALFTCVLPFAIVDDYGWWSVLIVAIVAFTLYGIEGIGVQLEDPFGYDRNDIKMDGIIEDTRQEVMVLLDEWRASHEGRAVGGMFD
ncbi:Bestrophin, RFP-TM, chloride channel-domain-containing protein [Paraphoma chrysanthemicola]|uniref:Bestrophin, RFP-TM, chloride channel-domain-containing protein n=1 Tax=Paraphoma chrysanthemicola TaxID=798071 RepID=A0A8K0VXK0_9PLEO|nr:Bestrophin, RFP-TM, chloride channel-domain-containing protein [Paraphoma chrysanthemicola]